MKAGAVLALLLSGLTLSGCDPGPTAYQQGWGWVASVDVVTAIKLFGPHGSCYEAASVRTRAGSKNRAQWIAGCRAAVVASRWAESNTTIPPRPPN